MKTPISVWSAIGTAAFGVAFATVLLVNHLVGEPSFLVLVVVTALCAFAVFVSPRLRVLNLKEMKLVLERIEKLVTLQPTATAQPGNGGS